MGEADVTVPACLVEHSSRVVQIIHVNRPRSLNPAGNSPIRGRGWYEFYPHGGLNGAEVIPVGDHRGGDGMQAPVPAPRGDLIPKAHILAMPNTCDI